MTEGNQIPPPPPPAETTPAGTPPIGYAGPSGYPGPYVGPGPDQNAKTFGMLAHLSAIIAGLVGLPFVGPLVVWLLKKNEHPFIDDQGKESLNFQITVAIALIVIAPTICLGIGLFLLPLVGIAALVLAIMGAIKANEGVAYRYPWTLRLIK
jgi:uncharacterized Tic20 family protein